MWKTIAYLWFKINGWKIEGNIPPEVKKAVITAAPHTSNWDFIHSRAAFFLMDKQVRFAIKKSFVDSPVGPLLRQLGAIAIDRSVAKKKISMVDFMVDLYNKNEDLYIMIAPEGTRKYVEKWKTGFFHIAKNAKVPVIPGYLDYERKVAGVGPVIELSGNQKEDIERIKSFYRPIPGKYPEKGVR